MMDNTVTQSIIDKLLEEASISYATLFDKCTVVAVQLKNGFVLVESSACVDKANYDYELGKQICLERIKNKLWELEGYYLQKQLSEEENNVKDQYGKSTAKGTIRVRQGKVQTM